MFCLAKWKLIWLPLIQGQKLLIGDDDLMDKNELRQEDIVEGPTEDAEKEGEEEEAFRKGLSSFTWIPKSNVRDREQKTIGKEAEILYSVPSMLNVNSPHMKTRGGVVGRVRKMHEKERADKRRFGGKQPRISHVNRWMADNHLSMGFPDITPWPTTIGSGGSGQKAVKGTGPESPRGGRETEGNWRPYKRDPVYR